MTTRALSPLESKLILCLERVKQFVVTIDDTMQILGVSYDRARQVLHRLARDRWLIDGLPGYGPRQAASDVGAGEGVPVGDPACA